MRRVGVGAVGMHRLSSRMEHELHAESATAKNTDERTKWRCPLVEGPGYRCAAPTPLIRAVTLRRTRLLFTAEKYVSSRVENMASMTEQLVIDSSYLRFSSSSRWKIQAVLRFSNHAYVGVRTDE